MIETIIQNNMERNKFAQIKIALENTRVSFDVYGAIVFGSRAKGSDTLYSDVDILIVAEGINPKRHRRGNEIVQIKQGLPALPMDILLLTPEETISNFMNHNPLFLDIAEDGVVLLDRNDFLKNLIDKTKHYIRMRGIERLEDGWKFPSEYGVVTYLSRVSNKDFAMAMFKDGERDYLISKRLLEEGFYDKSVYHSQQSVEKCVKAVLIGFGFFQKTHFVGEILRKALYEQNIPETWKRKLISIAEIAEGIEPEVSLSRYPGIIGDCLWLPFEEYEEEDASKALENAEKVLSSTREFLVFWFPEK